MVLHFRTVFRDNDHQVITSTHPILSFREAKAKEKEERALREKEEELKAAERSTPNENTSALGNREMNEDEEAKAAVVLQSNYRGYKERKKFKERHKTMAGAELEIPPTPTVNQDKDGEEPAVVVVEEEEEKEGKTEAMQGEEEEEEENTVEAEDDDDDSDHTQVAEDEDDEKHMEVMGEEIVDEEAQTEDAQREGREKDQEELGNGQEEAAEEEAVDPEQETKAATVLQSNFRGHRERKRLEEEGKIPARKQRVVSPAGHGEESMVEKSVGEEGREAGAKEEEETTDPQEIADVSTSNEKTEDVEEAKAAVVIQSNFRGHKERKRLKEEGKIPKKRKKKEVTPEHLTEEQVVQEDKPMQASQSDLSTGGQEEVDKENAATVIQSNFRGHRDRKKLKAERDAKKKAKEEATMVPNEAEVETEEALGVVDITDVELERKEETESQRERLEEEQAAVKIQNNFRGYKERKNMKANKTASQREAEELETFSKEVLPLDIYCLII